MTRKKRNDGFAAACICLATLLLVIVFIVKGPTFKENWEGSKDNRATEKKLEGMTETDVLVSEERSGDVNATSAEFDILQDENDRKKVIENNQAGGILLNEQNENNEGITGDSSILERSGIANDSLDSADSVSSNEGIKAHEENKRPVPVLQKKVSYTVYFIRVAPDGSTEKKAAVRTVEKSDSPLTQAINQLLMGPQDGDGDCETFIPEGTRLLGASVKNGVATLNFSEQFEFNRIGRDGIYGQLKQVVWTATEFNTVQSVLFLIEGKQKPYIGSEGIEIGGPISRRSFNGF